MALAGLAAPAAAQVSITALGTPVSENFNTLASSGTSSTVPPGWAFFEAGANANAIYTAGTGSSDAGDTYSFGTLSNPERAFGVLQSLNLIPTVGASFTNNTGAVIGQLDIVYTGEQWRLGATGRFDRLDFQYSTNAASLTTGTWIDVDPLDFTAPVGTGAAMALDGNAAANRAAVSAAISGLSIPNGATFWIRWTSFDASGADDGLAVDDFSPSASAIVTPTNPTGAGAASPPVVLPGGTTLLTVAVTPGANPTSTGLAVTADLTAIDGSATQAFFDDATNGDASAGDNVFSFQATVAPGATPGLHSLPASITDAQSRTGSATIQLTVQSASTLIVISQIYGGGGNSGATYTHDFIELYNRGTSAVSVNGWSVQYTSAGGSTWQATPLTGTIGPGQYYLVQEAAGAGGTTPLPTPDATGSIAMGAMNGKVALVSSATALTSGCPVSAAILDFVGYGSANCWETSPLPELSNTTAALRNGGGSVDTNSNVADFTVGSPDPRNSAGIPPSGTGTATPASALPGETTLLTVVITPGDLPPGTTHSVTVNLTPIDGSATQALFDDGMHDDGAAGDLTFAYLATIGSVGVGPKTIVATISDNLARSSTTAIAFAVEPSLSMIHDIQGPGLRSPVENTLVATIGIVTAVKFNGFFIQSRDADVDANSATSEGVFAFTGSTPSLAVGSRVKVTGTVQEFVPSQDPFSPPVTELVSPTITMLSAEVLPGAMTLTAADTSPTGTLEQLERFEGMRVSVGALRVIAPTQGSVTESTAISSSNGTFYGVIDGVPRPFRQPGIDVSLPLPPGAPCCVPIFDANPERLRVDSDALVGSAKIEVTAGALVSSLTGPLDYGFRTYTILPEPAPPPIVSGNVSATPVPEAGELEFTVGSYNLERFFDTADDPSTGEPILTTDAFEDRLNKASLSIRNVMRTPDILGIVEVEDLPTLQAIAARINADAVNAGDPSPAYVAYLENGNDIGGIDVGFLVKSTRVDVVDVTQIGKDATYINPNNNQPELLNDRPSLVLRALVDNPLGASFPVTVIVNHLRSLSGIDDPADGDRIRAKRRAQAEFLANEIQTRQEAGERIVSVGDYNAFQFNDGYVDTMGTIVGGPAPANQVVLASDDLVNPDLTNLVEMAPASDRYSFSFDGSAQVLDHVVVDSTMLLRFDRFHYARNNTDFPESYRNDPLRPERLSDHDMPVAYFALPGAPTLTLNGSNPMTVECCTGFTDPGATASDVELGDLTSSIVVTGTVDSTTVGTYILTYSVSNQFATSTLTRTVNVVDTTPPELVLNGSSSLTIELGTPFTDPGATAIDTCAGDLTAAISVSGSVDPSTVGPYQLTCQVSDGFNTVSVTRTVHVVDTAPPTISGVVPNPANLWPPNHKMVPVNFSYTATDVSGPVTCELAVASNEPVSGQGPGDLSPDWQIIDAHNAMLRAEKGLGGSDRVYTVTVTCRDASQNASSATTTVRVGK